MSEVLSLKEAKDLIESKLCIAFDARNFTGLNTLTYWGKPWVEIHWHEEQKEEGFWMDIRPSETAKGFLYSSFYRQISMKEVLAKLGQYFKERVQISLFDGES